MTRCGQLKEDGGISLLWCLETEHGGKLLIPVVPSSMQFGQIAPGKKTHCVVAMVC